MAYRDKEKYNEYMKVYMLKRYHERMELAREKLGRKCLWCDETEDLELDHIDKADKSFSIGKMWSISIDKFWAELEKCQLLCREHHKEKSVRYQDNTRQDYLDNPRPHGTITKYTYWNCRCDLCRKAAKEYKANRKGC